MIGAPKTRSEKCPMQQQRHQNDVNDAFIVNCELHFSALHH